MSTRITEIVICGLTAISLVACAAVPETDDSISDESIVAQLAERLAAAEKGGASGILRVTHDGEVMFESGFGSATCNIFEEMTPSHVFMIGSITKELTRVLAFVLEERGFLSFDNTVNDYLPGFSGDIGRVTIRQLLHHTGGLPDLINASGQPVEYTVEYDYIPVNRDELLNRAEFASLLFEPDEREEYSNLGFQLLAAIYEVVTGEDFQALLQRYVFEPAGMSDIGFWFNDLADLQFVNGCQSGDIHWGNPIEDSMWDSSGPSWNLNGAGGLLSTAESLGYFFEGVGDGVFFQSTVQSERYKNDRMVYSDRRKQRVMGPSGSNGIFYAVAFWAERSKLNIILMTNRADHQAGDQLFQDLLNLFPPSYFLRSDQL